MEMTPLELIEAIDDAVRTVGVMLLYPDGYTYDDWLIMARYLNGLEALDRL